MKGSETKLLEYLEDAKKRFVIPVYQRNYDWKTENCKQLYDLFSRKDEIERQLGDNVNWWRFEGKSSYIDYSIDTVGMRDETSWTQMAKFHTEWRQKVLDVFVPLLREFSI